MWPVSPPRHQSIQRLLTDTRTTVDKAEAEAERSRQAVRLAEEALATSATAFDEAERAQSAARALAADTEAALAEAEAARAETQGREAEARAARSEAEGEANALRAEVAALGRLIERDSHAGSQVLDRLTVEPGFEKALGAALADDLRAPEIAQGGRSGWVELPAYDTQEPLPEGAAPLSAHVAVPGVLRRRIAQIGSCA